MTPTIQQQRPALLGGADDPAKKSECEKEKWLKIGTLVASALAAVATLFAVLFMVGALTPFMPVIVPVAVAGGAALLAAASATAQLFCGKTEEAKPKPAPEAGA